jgi:predicted metal-dependent hydrolase
VSDPESRADAPPSAALLHGIDQFNHGEYFECHETLEELWLEERMPLRGLYQGILQVGVALHHLRAGNYRGARGLLGKGMGHLTPFAPRALGVDVAGLLAAAQRCDAALAILGPERIEDVDWRLAPRIAVQGASGGPAERQEPR